VPWQLEIARFSAPIVDGIATVAAFAVPLRESTRRFRFQFVSGHTNTVPSGYRARRATPTVLTCASGNGRQLIWATSFSRSGGVGATTAATPPVWLIVSQRVSSAVRSANVSPPAYRVELVAALSAHGDGHRD
jgi:hypothetical protein